MRPFSVPQKLSSFALASWQFANRHPLMTACAALGTAALFGPAPLALGYVCLSSVGFLKTYDEGRPFLLIPFLAGIALGVFGLLAFFSSAHYLKVYRNNMFYDAANVIAGGENRVSKEGIYKQIFPFSWKHIDHQNTIEMVLVNRKTGFMTVEVSYDGQEPVEKKIPVCACVPK